MAVSPRYTKDTSGVGRHAYNTRVDHAFGQVLTVAVAGPRATRPGSG